MMWKMQAVITERMNGRDLLTSSALESAKELVSQRMSDTERRLEHLELSNGRSADKLSTAAENLHAVASEFQSNLRDQAEMNGKITHALESLTNRMEGIDVTLENTGLSVAAHGEAITTLKQDVRSIRNQAYMKSGLDESGFKNQ